MRSPVKHVVPLALIAALAACGGGPKTGSLPVQAATGPAADYPMVIGAPFNIGGVTYNPSDKLNYDAVGYAANGTEGGAGISAAHKTLPLPSYAEVTSLDSGKTILVRIERRGPMDNDTLAELSPGAAEQLGVAGNPRAPIRLRRVNPPEAERAPLRSGQRVTERMETPKGLLDVLLRKLNGGTPALAAKPALPSPTAEPSTSPHIAAAVPASTPVAASSPKPVTPKQAIPKQPRPAASPAPAAATGADQLVVQVAAFSSRERADAAAAKLGAGVSPTGRLWRVRLGPFAMRNDAEPALAKAKAAGYSDARIQRAN